MLKLILRKIVLVGGLLALQPKVTIAATLDVPNVSHGIFRSDSDTLLNAEAVNMILRWLHDHRDGWRNSFATAPAPTAMIVLGSDRSSPELQLNLWLGPKYLGWSNTVIAISHGVPVGIRTFKGNELRDLLKCAGESPD